MAKIWLTYAWADNQHQDIDFLAQELITAGLTVKLDRWNIGAGQLLWEQIENFIQNPDESDAWVIVATQASLGSKACCEEFAMALDRALNSRGAAFPIIGLFNGPVDRTLVPASIRARRCVSTSDRDWKTQVIAAAEGRAPAISRTAVEAYRFHIHQNTVGRSVAFEMRPRGGTWSPFVAAIPIGERAICNPAIMHAPADVPRRAGSLFNTGAGPSADGQWWCMYAQNEATPTQSYYLFADRPPSRIIFGVNNGEPLHAVDVHQG